jgi:creatinine amidohydrolase
MRWRAVACRLALAALALPIGGPAIAAASVYLEQLTTTEVQAALRAGTTTIILPVGGTEQNGPHMALGKHNARATLLAGRIAALLGNALVAPVLSHVPEGSISPPGGHMRFAGTISVPEAAFKAILDGSARSFRQHGFTDMVLIGDSGNYQSQLREVAARLNRDWAGTPARAHYIAEYYQTVQTRYVLALRERGLTAAQIGVHAGSADTSLMLAVDASLVRPEQFAAAALAGTRGGAEGDPRAATAALGQLGVDAVVEQTVAAIRRSVARR